MKKFIKEWWFSLFCYSMALALPIFTIIAILLFDNDLLFMTFTLICSVTPTLMFIVIGVANQPRRENKDE